MYGNTVKCRLYNVLGKGFRVLNGLINKGEWGGIYPGELIGGIKNRFKMSHSSIDINGFLVVN